ncbi:MAG: AI-2E family transporter [Kiritimatiellae bacterium]|nr:AI-2E family transporter [Kiritimatiellia bacterium]
MIEFTEGQRKTVASGLTVLSLAAVFAFVGVVAWLLLKVLALAAPAIVPLALGLFLSMFFKPYYIFWKGLVRNSTFALVVMLATVLVPLGLLLWYAGAVLTDQALNLMRQAPQLIAQATEWFRQTFPRGKALLDQLGVPYENLGELYTVYGPTALRAGTGALKLLGGVVTAVLTLVFFVFFLTTRARRGGEVADEMLFLKSGTRHFVAVQIDTFFDILVSFFQRQTVICLIEGCLYGAGFALVGLPYGFLIGFALGVLNLVPFLGSLVCLPVALPMAYFVHDGSLTRLVLVLCVWGAGQILDGYVITPRIQGNRTGLGYAGVIFSFIFWSTLLGPLLGMLLAIPLSAFCVVLWRALKATYLRPNA